MLARSPHVNKARTPGEAAEARLARLERFLAASFVSAIAEAREMFSEATLVRLITEAGLPGELMKAAPEPVVPKWYEAGVSRLALLGQAAGVAWVEPARFLARWRSPANLGTPPLPPVMAAIGRQVERGEMLAPAIIAKLPGGGWGFLDGRARFLYAAQADAERAPLVMPAADLAEFAKEFKSVLANGVPPAPLPGDLGTPREVAGQPAHLIEAIDAMVMKAGNRFAGAIVLSALASAEGEAKRIAEMLEKRRRASKLGVGVDFTTPNYNAINQVQSSALNLVREFGVEQRQAVLAVLQDGVARGINPNELARSLRSSVGLTSYQEGVVNNYRRALEQAHMDAGKAANALGRALRDGRYDRSVAAALRNQAPLTADQIDKMVGRYRERWIDYRARTIARTEGLRAAHMGELAAWEAAIASGDVQANEIIQTWETARDDRVRHTHVSLQGQQRPYGTPFITSGYARLRFPGDPEAPPEEVINCRCVLTRQITEKPLPKPADASGEIAAAPSEYDQAARVQGAPVSLPRGFGQTPSAPIDAILGETAGAAGVGGQVVDAMAASEIRAILEAYEKQLKTKLGQDLTGYMSTLAKEIPKGKEAVGKTIAMKEGATLSTNAREAIRSASTVLRVNMQKGQSVLFTDPKTQALALPPGTRFVIRGKEKVSRDEYLRRTGATGEFAVRGGAQGVLIVAVDIVEGVGGATLAELIAFLRSELDDRAAGLRAIELDIAGNLAVKAADARLSGSRRDAARYLAEKFSLPVVELFAGEPPLVDRYLASIGREV